MKKVGVKGGVVICTVTTPMSKSVRDAGVEVNYGGSKQSSVRNTKG